jgi:serine-type D-Ala-D-Ala carboxypeptidase/endopeptidase (penicillin-binding protein 4)
MHHNTRTGSARRRRAALALTAAAAAIGMAAGTAALTASSAAARPAGSTGSVLDPRITAIMDKPAYQHAQWGLLEVDSAGTVIRSMFPGQFFIPGSVTKLFSVSAALNMLGPGHRFTTPVYAVGQRQGMTLTGNLVLVGEGDQALGGRTTPSGGIAYTNNDHGDANVDPGTTLTPEDPLAGLDALARQVRASGIRQVIGNVIVNDRLFGMSGMTPNPTPLMINDNLIDLLTSPGAGPGAPARLSWRPQVAPYQVTSSVRTVAAGGATDIAVSTSADGTRISLSGTIAANARPVVRVSDITDPAAFGRTAFIEALARAGVSVTATPTGSNPASLLPPSYQGDRRVAAYTSPPYGDYARFILKVSNNVGANLAICQLAVTAGSHDCTDGFGVMRSSLQRAGVDPAQVQFADGRGGAAADRVTPQAVVELLRYWMTAPSAAQFRQLLPVLGVDGTLADSCTSCAAKGKVFAKTGTEIGGDYVNVRFSVQAKSLGGYLQAGNGSFDVFFLVTNDAVVTNGVAAADGAEAVLRTGDDLADIAAILQQDAASGR